MSNPNIEQRSQFKTLIHQQELDRIAGWVQEYPNLETGGDLFGFWSHSGFPVVQLVIGPGKNSRHNSTSFFQDKNHLIKTGEILREKYGLQHIGEWHSHHQIGLAQPSIGDERTVFNALRTYNFPRFLLCISNLSPKLERFSENKFQVTVGCFLFTLSPSHYQTGSWVVLPNKSPIRKDLETDNNILFSSPLLNNDWNVKQTTLEEQILLFTEPIEISENVWYSTTEGKDSLKRIVDSLNVNYQNCQIKRRVSSEEIYLIFERKHYQNYQKNDDLWQIDFSKDFPHTSPLIKINNGKSFYIKNWNNKDDYFTQIEACVQRYYNDKWSE